MTHLEVTTEPQLLEAPADKNLIVRCNQDKNFYISHDENAPKEGWLKIDPRQNPLGIEKGKSIYVKVFDEPVTIAIVEF